MQVSAKVLQQFDHFLSIPETGLGQVVTRQGNEHEVASSCMYSCKLTNGFSPTPPQLFCSQASCPLYLFPEGLPPHFTVITLLFSHQMS